MTGSVISGLGISLPDAELTNAELADRIGVDEGWILSRTGISTRRIASSDETASSLGTVACLEALDSAGCDPADVDLIICATVTPDVRFPATACLIQAAIGARAAAFDMNAGCSGWLYALAQADSAIRAGSARRVLVVGSEVLSRITDQTDPKTAVLFGDGAGAALVTSCDGPTRVGPFSLYADGSRPELLHVPAKSDVIHMEGREVYRAAVEAMSSATAAIVTRGGFSLPDVDLLVAHQANQRILDAVVARLGLSEDKAVSNISRYGNTSAASIPIALFEMHQAGRLQDDDLLVLTAFGAGFTWGAGLVRWGTGHDYSGVLAAVGEIDA